MLFKNGYYTFETKEFSNDYSPLIFFPFRVDRNYNENPNEVDVDYINKVVFNDVFGDSDTETFIKQKIARGLAGIGMMDKSLVTFIGEPNSGKGLLTDAISNAAGPYVSTINSGIFVNGSKFAPDKDSVLSYKDFLLNRYKRILLTNELKPLSSLNGTLLQQCTSAGDPMEGRLLHGQNVKFTPCFTLFLYANDKPRIVPLNDTKKGRIINVNMPYIFTEDPTEPNEKLADPDIKSVKLKQIQYIDAFFHIVRHSYLKTSPNVPQSVKDSTKEWNKADNFIESLLDEFKVTKDQNDYITNDEIMSFIKDRGFEITATKMGIMIKTIKGIEKDRLGSGVRIVKYIKRKSFDNNDDEPLSTKTNVARHVKII